MKIYYYKKCNRLKKQEDITFIYNNGIKIKSKFYIFYFLPNKLKESRLCISISKKIGKSVVRNREKRIIREFFRIEKVSFDIPIDLIVIMYRYTSNKLEKLEDLGKTFNTIKNYDQEIINKNNTNI